MLLFKNHSCVSLELLYLTRFIIIDRDSHSQLFPFERERERVSGGKKLSENICEFRSNNREWRKSYRWLSHFTLSLSFSLPLLSLAFINLLPPTCSSVLNYLLTPANLLAAELWSALNELLREHHKLEYSALGARTRDVGQRALPWNPRLNCPNGMKCERIENVFVAKFHGRNIFRRCLCEKRAFILVIRIVV